MDSSHAQRAEQIFLAAIELAPQDRSAYLARACGDDLPVRQEAAALLEAFERSADYFQQLPDRLAVANLLDDIEKAGAEQQQVSPGAVGECYGHYTLVTPIGSGGSGSVWLAERNDGRFEGSVAIKLLSSMAARARFEREGAYLAKLSHPNIARLIDAGVTAAGQPFLVLEYVEGTPIDHYCDAHRLGIEQRIRLFLQVLDSVSHAHARLIVHRDIKPSNVQVTHDGTVKLLDFGIAKLLSDDADLASELTRQVGSPLTPQFAAPEQLDGGPITTSTDLYSLGLLLWLIVTGCTPRQRENPETLAELRALAHRDPTRLLDTIPDASASVDASEIAARRGTNLPSLIKALTGDLDSIVRRAVAVDPADRYVTVADLAQDLRRYLNHEPVLARPQTMGYRVRKFVRRHRGGVLTATVTLFAVLLSAALAIWQSIEARQQRDAALYQQQRVQGTNEFLQLLLSEIGPGGEPLTMIELLDRGVQMLDRQFTADSRFKAQTLYDISLHYAAAGRVETQLRVLQRATQIAAELRDDNLLATTLCAQARALLPSDSRAAADAYRRGRAALSTAKSHGLEAGQECHRAAAQMSDIQGERDAAIASLTTALREQEAHPIASDPARAVLLNDLSEQYVKAERFSDALDVNSELIETMDRIGRGGTVTQVIYLLNRGAILNRGGEVLSAASAQREALARIEKLTQAGQAPVGAQGHYASSLYRLAQYEEALTLFRAGLEEARLSNNARWIAQHDLMLGQTLARMGKAEEAEVHLAAADSVYRRNPEGNQRFLNLLDCSRAELALSAEAINPARDHVAQALQRLGYPANKDAPGLAGVLLIASKVELAAREWRNAEQLASDALAAASKTAREPTLSADVGQALLARARARLALEDRSGAEDDLAAALISLSNSLGPDHPDTIAARTLGK